jgi:hypothetical protein
MKPTTTILLLVTFMLAACTHKPGLVPVVVPTPTGCDTVNATYAKDIQPIFSSNCYSCHGTGVTTGGGLDLEDTAQLKNYLKNSFRGDGIYGSKLYHCMLHSPLAQQMPPTYIVDSCSLKKVHYWLSQGGPIN